MALRRGGRRLVAGVAGAAGLYVGYSCWKGVDPELPELHYCRTARNAAILDQCPTLSRPFAPVPWLTNRHLQSLLYVLYSATAMVDWQEVDRVPMPDGGTVRVLWDERPDLRDDRPIVILMHGLTGCSRNMGPHLRKLKAAGFRVVGLDRRGHAQGLTTPAFSVFGDGEDVARAVQAIQAKAPKSHMALLSLCAGGGTMLHYVLLEHEKQMAAKKSGVYIPSPVRACVALSPALDLPECLRTLSQSPVYNPYFVYRLKKIFLQPNKDLLAAHPAYDACNASTTFIGFVKAHLPFAKYPSFERYMDNFDFGRFMEASKDLRLDSLVVAAFNDPVCVRSTMADYVSKVDTSPYLTFALTHTGSHVGWFEWRGRRGGLAFWADDVVLEWLSAVLGPHRSRPPLRST